MAESEPGLPSLVAFCAALQPLSTARFRLPLDDLDVTWRTAVFKAKTCSDQVFVFSPSATFSGQTYFINFHVLLFHSFSGGQAFMSTQLKSQG